MPIFFASSETEGNVGKVVACSSKSAQGLIGIVGLDPKISWESERALITQQALDQQTNQQFLHSIGNDVFVYMFGDQIGQLTLQGIAAARGCAGLSASTVDLNEHGLSKMLTWWNTNRASNRSGLIVAQIGNHQFRGLATRFVTNVEDAGSMLVRFTLFMHVLPEKFP